MHENLKHNKLLFPNLFGFSLPSAPHQKIIHISHFDLSGVSLAQCSSTLLLLMLTLVQKSSMTDT